MDGAGGRKVSQHMYILMPNETQAFYSDLEQGHVSKWDFLTDYEWYARSYLAVR